MRTTSRSRRRAAKGLARELRRLRAPAFPARHRTSPSNNAGGSRRLFLLRAQNGCPRRAALLCGAWRRTYAISQLRRPRRTHGKDERQALQWTDSLHPPTPDRVTHVGPPHGLTHLKLLAIRWNRTERSRFLIGRIFLRRTGIHFVGKCSSALSVSCSHRKREALMCSTHTGASDRCRPAGCVAGAAPS